MKSPPLSATSLDEPQPFSIPNQGEFVLTNPNFIVLDLNVLWEGLNTMTFEGSPCCAIGHTVFMELVVTLLNVLKMHHAEIYVRNLILSRLSQNLRKWFYVLCRQTWFSVGHSLRRFLMLFLSKLWLLCVIPKSLKLKVCLNYHQFTL